MTSAPPPPPPTVQPPAWQPPPPSGLPDRPQLRRSRTDKVLGGVNGGLAEYTGIDALLWRVGFVALTLAAGSGVLVYLLLWVLLPAGPDAGPGSAPAVRARRPAEPRSPVPGITLAALLIVLGTGALLARFTDWDLDAGYFLGTALLLVGLGLVAAAFTGGRRARGGLIALGVALSVAVAVEATDPWPADAQVGDRTFAPQTAAGVREVYEGGVGDLTIDLSDVPLADLDEVLEIEVQHGIGNVEVVVPRSADVRVEVMNGLGDIDVFGESDAGPRTYPGSGSAAWSDDGELEFDLDIHAGVGEVEVSRG
ncbi:PspC domain-containing protein [Blastococcus sp. TF02A_35]|uniref:PspC domain-containing protein n=1 Tax=Blastococcus sp. TF02A-35 TaxID=2559612 RepID=UPI0010737A08|nr:PspC domain-containing protein [Blastococcus sp. TF02A_35]TFV53516.1 PspC domain-containing protein [Blastococcus sp. TF02A_35]